ncbi:hypothetical protein A2U01_0074451, partial [Trifolium medium]|nr:hypothetical protein [Trifolium medium]
MARCARAEHEEWISSANCALRRQGWRVTPASGKQSQELLSSARRAGEDGVSRQLVGLRHQEGSVSGASRSFIWRVADLHCSSRAPHRTGGAVRRR